MEYIISDIYDGKRRKLYRKLCRVCSKEMFIPRHINKKYCSVICRGIGMKTASIVSCAWCNKEFEKRQAHKKNSKSGLFFCSRICKDAAQRYNGGLSALHLPHYGVKEGTTSYRKYALQNKEHRCEICGITDWNNKPIIFDVHHIDSDRMNTSLENLKIVCPNCHRQIESETGWGRS